MTDDISTMNDQTKMDLEGFEVIMKVRASGNVAVFINTPDGFTGDIRIRLNDGMIYNANPDLPERVDHTPMDGFHIVNA